jgi:hypothetical protein
VSINTRSLTVLALLIAFFSAISAWASPHISSISPTAGPVSPVGSSLTINGSGFGTSASGNTVTVGGISTTPTSWSDTRIVAAVPGVLLPGFADVIVTSGNVASNAASFLVIPVILNNSPLSGPVNTSVVVTGTSFGDTQGESTVTFNGVAASPTAWSNTSVTVPAPPGATTGDVVVTVNGFSTNGATFRVLPNITAIGPASGTVGSLVTLSGTTFGQTQGFGGVAFNGVGATVQSWSDSSITVLVPSGATSGNVIVTDHQLLASNAVNFNVITPPAPAINFISPDAGRAGIGVTISGSNFGATQSGGTVTFNGLPAAINSWSDGSISATVPSGIHTGPVVVTTQGEASNGVQFTFSPGIRFSAQTVYIMPDEIALEVNSTRSFKALDSAGHAITDASWSVDNSSLAVVSGDQSSGIGTVTALASGEVTVTMTSSLGSTLAKVTIFDVGTTPVGTPLWSVFPQTQGDLLGSTIKARQSGSNSPYIYLPASEGNLTTIRALDNNGVPEWLAQLNPVAPSDFSIFPLTASGTSDGGLLLLTGEEGPSDFNTFFHFSSNGTKLWSYNTPTDLTQTPALAPDGSIYFWSFGDTANNHDNALIVLNDSNGTERYRYHANNEQETFTSFEQLHPGDIPCAQQPGVALPFFFGANQTDPVIAADGNAYLMVVSENVEFDYSVCNVQAVPNSDPTVYNIVRMEGNLSYTTSLQLVQLTPGGPGAAVTLSTLSYSGPAVYNPGWILNGGASKLPLVGPGSYSPDADGGLLVMWQQFTTDPNDTGHGFLSRVFEGSIGYTVPPPSGSISVNIVTNDDDIAFLEQRGFGGSVTAISVNNGATLWSIPSVRMNAATSDGGVFLENNDGLVHVNAAGTIDSAPTPTNFTSTYLEENLFTQRGSTREKKLIEGTLTADLAAGYAVPSVGSPAAAKKAAFNPVTDDKCSGFDNSVDPVALVVPFSGTQATSSRDVHIKYGNWQHVIVRSSDLQAFTVQISGTSGNAPPSVSLTGKETTLTLTAVSLPAANTTKTLQFVENNVVVGEIEVDIKKVKSFTVFPYSVVDSVNLLQPQAPASTDLKTELDRIYPSQTAVTFSVNALASTTLRYDDDNSNALANFTVDPSELLKITATVAVNPLTILYVNAFDKNPAGKDPPLGLTATASTPGNPSTGGPTAIRNKIANGSYNGAPNLTAHEIGHYMGAGDVTTPGSEGDLMWDHQTSTQPCRLKKRDWDLVNPPGSN